MNKERLQQYYTYIDGKHTEYYIANSGKRKDATTINRVVDDVRRYVKFTMDDDTYIRCNDGRGSGLFEPGFVDTDFSRTLRILTQLIEESEE